MVRVLSTKPRQYYRLDAPLDAKGGFTWPRTLIDHPRIRLEPVNTKAMACERSCDTPLPRLYPVTISESAARPSGGVTVWFRAGVDLSQLLVTVSRVERGARKPVLERTDLLAGRTLIAGVAKDLILEASAGSFVVKAIAVPKGGSSMDEVEAELVLD